MSGRFEGSERRREGNTMRVTTIVVGVLLILLGLVWVLQGVGILPGSFMTGQPFWAYMGAIALVAGAGLVWFGGGRARA